MKNRKRIFYAAAAFVLVAVIYNVRIQVTTYHQKRDLEKAFLGYSQSIKSRDYGGAYSYGDPDFRAAVDLPTFAAQQAAFESKFGALKAIDRGEYDMRGRGSPMQWTAIVEEIRRYDRGEVHFACEFHLEDGRWQVFGCKQTS